MSNKGKVFTHADLPRFTQQRIIKKQVSPAQLKKLDAQLAEQTARNAIVAHTEDGEPLIAEELVERALLALGPERREVATMLMRLSEADRVVVLRAFDTKGRIRLPFKMV